MSQFKATAALLVAVFFAWMAVSLIVVRVCRSGSACLNRAIDFYQRLWVRAAVAAMVATVSLSHYAEPVVMFIEKAPFI